MRIICFDERPGRDAGPFVYVLLWRGQRGNAGFSLVELVVTLVLLGIMAVVFMPRLGSTGLDQRGFRDGVIASLRYAQKSAVASRRTVCATFSNAPVQVSFRISSLNGASDCTVGNALAGPDGQAYVLSAPQATTFASIPISVIFDAAGRPLTAATISIAGLPATQAISVESETGYVH